MSASFRNFRDPEPVAAPPLLPAPPSRPEIFVPLEPDDLMLSAATYLFWPVLAPFLLFGRRGRIAYVRFHCVQSIWFGLLTGTLFSLVTLLVMGAFRVATTPDRLWEGWIFVAAFFAWLTVLLTVFLVTLFFAWRAGQGHVFKLPLVGKAIERKALDMAEDDIEGQ